MDFRLCCVGVKLWIIFELEAFCIYKAACKIKTELDTVKTDIYDPRTQFIHMQADSQAKNIFQCGISSKKCTKGNGINWKPGAPQINVNNLLKFMTY